MANSHSFKLLLLAVSMVGCRSTQYARDPEFARTTQAMHAAYGAPETVEVVSPIAHHLEGRHPVEEYIRHALDQNPEIHAARKRMEAYAHQVPVAASLQDPMLSLTVLPEQIQTAAGQQELIVSASQKVPWKGKLQSKAEVAEAQTNVSRAHLAATELATVAKVKRAYYDLYFIEQAIDVTKAEQRLLTEIRDVANVRYKTGKTSQQDVLRADLEISAIENELIQLGQQHESAQARLARLLHVSPQTKLQALAKLSAERIPNDLNLLQHQAVTARPELHAQLAALQRDRKAVDLANLEYKPDVTLGFSWVDISSAGISPVANGRDAFMLTAGVNLPVYRKRLDAGVRSAEAKAVSTARDYDALRDITLEEVTDLFAQAKSQQEMLVLFREDILPKARQTLEVSSRAYNVGEVDFLQLVDNWRQLLRYEIAQRHLDATLRKTLAELERVVGGMPQSTPLAAPTPAVPQN